MFFTKPWQIVFHILGWMLMFSLMLAFVSRDDWSRAISAGFITFCAIFIFLFYLNAYFLIPRLLLRKKYVPYFIITAVLFAAIFFSRPFDSLHLGENGPREEMRFDGDHGPPHEMLPGGPPHEGFERGPRRGPAVDLVSIILFVTVWSVSMANTIIREWRQTQQQAAQAEADRAKAELSFLRAQINPHFLFNTLNNIYSLAVTKNEHTSTAIMKLSNIMRYVTDDVTQQQVPLQSEVDCISDYIDLQKLRLSDKTQVEFSVSGDLEMKSISPLILMTFVENVFKYGISAHEPSPIVIRIMADEKGITLFCSNRVFSSQPKLERMGIGLSNTKQRLEHLYPGKHLLEINEESGFYNVRLKIFS